MCTVCGCSEGEVSIEGHHHHHGHSHSHQHGDHHHPADDSGHSLAPPSGDADNASVMVSEGDNLHFGQGPAHAHAPGLSQGRMVQIEQDILGKNDRYAGQNRQRFEAMNLFALNLVSSPGSGKTTLLTASIEQLQRCPVAVIEGDQQTANDADRIRATGVQAVQVNTGKGCHLDAHMVGHAMERFDDLSGGVLFIENVGNLVCPAAFDLGEAHKVAILSVTEGEDKPLKYPDMFYAADLMLLNKVDLLPYLDFDVEQCIAAAKQVNPDIEVIQISARSGEGMSEWLNWIEQHRVARIHQRIEQLNNQVSLLQGMV
ncbi:hydrogenase nickel incorporation protein HypB [Amphritea sp. 2_MG-2023]|uniref:hydrogenase nickel incorporation protein HypB n=1 Tax=Amphritea TaxID=515417 RepID=UPI001C079A27|nr:MULTISPECIES: hydrogenase nickel incorporation protein HypB [Amphritea]MBU2966409.1 hydrogenase nickel incorporation protein HypB [Amphritea atlantica]MDO6419847.1 hydrogenase nickel incorporation protein HypB [Amphritea sp. 2_MG-2023]MDX2422060.1 hydrogenase nickel incorporation protein HypB [Amphritea sp.]